VQFKGPPLDKNVEKPQVGGGSLSWWFSYVDDGCRDATKTNKPALIVRQHL
jgi:hypothetical protein